MGRSAQSPAVDLTKAAPDSSASPSTRGSRSLPAIFVAALTVVAALVTALTLLLLDARSATDDEKRDALVVDTAREVVVNLTTLNHNDPDGDIERILAGTTGSFRDEFTATEDSFRQVLNMGQVESAGEIKEAGLIDADDSSAQVLVAAASTVKNADAPEGQSRVYRMKVSLESVDGSWLVSNVEFVS